MNEAQGIVGGYSMVALAFRCPTCSHVMLMVDRAPKRCANCGTEGQIWREYGRASLGVEFHRWAGEERA